MDSLTRNSVGLVLAPIDIVAPVDLTAAASPTVCATFASPPSGLFTKSNYFQTGYEILGIQMVASQALSGGGTAGVVGLFINGVESTVAPSAGTKNWSRLTHGNGVVTKGKVVNASVESFFSITADQPGGAIFGAVSGATWYPVTVAADLIEIRMITQGTVGVQTYWFQLYVRPALFKES
jgi:hypothetical protein